MTRIVAALIAGAALTGCASLYNVDADVSSFSRWPAGRRAGTYAFERLAVAAGAAAASADARGRRAAGDPNSAAWSRRRKAAPPTSRSSSALASAEAGPSPYDDPFWYGGMYPWNRPFGYGRYGRTDRGPYGGPYWGGGWYRGYGGYYSPYYDREAAVLIRDRRSGEPLYEARAASQGPTIGLTTVLPALFIAAMRDFPAGSTANPHRVTVEAPH